VTLTELMELVLAEHFRTYSSFSRSFCESFVSFPISLQLFQWLKWILQ